MKVFFFSSRRRHTRYWRDWSSDVCSSDLGSYILEWRSLQGLSDISAEMGRNGKNYLSSESTLEYLFSISLCRRNDYEQNSFGNGRFYASVFIDSLGLDRKSTRLNSSHANISYAVFCLKKK